MPYYGWGTGKWGTANWAQGSPPTSADLDFWYRGSVLINVGTNGDFASWFHGSLTLSFGLIAVRAIMAGNFEALLRPTPAVAIPYEAMRAGITEGGAVPYEARWVPVAQRITPIESRIALVETQGIPFVADLGLVAQDVPIFEALGGLHPASVAPYEAGKGLAKTAQEPWEGLRGLMKAVVVPYAGLTGLDAALDAAYEALVGLSLTVSVPYMAVGWLFPTGLVQWEGLKGIVQVKTLPWEILRGSVRQAVANLESRRRFRFRLVTPYESGQTSFSIVARATVPYEALGLDLSTFPTVLIPPFGRLLLGPAGHLLTLTTDPEPYAPYAWPKRASFHQILGGGMTIQDFGVWAADRRITLRHDVLDLGLSVALDTWYQAKTILILRDWMGNEFLVKISNLTLVPHTRLRVAHYEIELAVSSITKAFGDTYGGA
jgi:hypothetical protein